MKPWAFLIVFVLILTPLVVLGQSDDTPIDPALQAQMDGLDATTARLRGLKILQPVTRVFPSRTETETYLRTLLDEEITPEQLFEYNQFYQAFDFVDGEVDLLQIYGDLLVSQVAGFYDPETQTMNVLLLSDDELGDELPVLEQVLYVHEFTHALQDQHFALDPFYEVVEDTSDQAMARQALVEGDASFVMQNFMIELIEENPLTAAALLLNQAALDAEIPEGTPKILENELLMPYLDGLNFITALVADGGLKAVDHAFENPPQSTEQILHPERYLRGDQPIPVALQPIDPADVLGSGWSFVMDDTLGEFYLREFLATQLPNRDAGNAAEGWGGDHYALFFNGATDQRAWVLQLAWDSAAERVEFLTLFNTYLQTRYDDDLKLMRGDNETRCWVGEIDTLCFQTVDDAVIITHAPDFELSMELMSSQTGE